MIRPKSFEQISAESAVFADNLEPAYRPLGFMALEHSDQFENGTYVGTVDYHLGRPFQHTIRESDFIASLRSQENRRLAKHIEGLLSSYGEFKQSISALQSNPDEERSSHRRYSPDSMIASGGSSSVYKFSHDGCEYALRVARGTFTPTAETVHRHLTASVVTEDLRSFETVVAASYDDGVTVGCFFPGDRLSDLDVTKTPIDPEHIEQLHNDLLVADRREIVLDVNPDNFLYDPKQGFLVLDHAYTPTRRRNGLRLSAPSELIQRITSRGYI